MCGFAPDVGVPSKTMNCETAEFLLRHRAYTVITEGFGGALERNNQNRHAANLLNNNGKYDKYIFGSDSILASILVHSHIL